MTDAHDEIFNNKNCDASHRPHSQYINVEIPTIETTRWSRPFHDDYLVNILEQFLKSVLCQRKLYLLSIPLCEMMNDEFWYHHQI
jgi:hypothetical protein